MKQVIVRIKDCRATYSKTISRAYYYSVNQYESEVLDFVKTLMPGQEIHINVGRNYYKFISYEDLLENAQINESTFDDEMYHEVIDDDFLMSEIKDYLPRY